MFRYLIFSISLVFLFSSCSKKETAKKEVNKKTSKISKKEVKKETSKTAKKEVNKKTSKTTAKTNIRNNQSPEAIVAAIEGKVEIKKPESDDYTVATKNNELFVADQLRVVGENSMAKLRMWDDSIIILGPGAEIVINPGADLAHASPSITILSGVSNMMIEPRTEDQDVFTVYTPSAILSVLGTEFDVAISDAGNVKLGVTDGLVEVSDQDGNKKIEIPKNKAIEISLEGKISKPVAYKSDEKVVSKWLDEQNKLAKDKIDTITKTASDKLKSMEEKLEKLKKQIKELETASENANKKLEIAVNKKDLKLYDIEDKKAAPILEEANMAAHSERNLKAMLTANYYLLLKLQAMVDNGIVKPTSKQKKLLDSLNTQVKPLILKYDASVAWRRYIRRRRRWKRHYIRHTARGRLIAKKINIKLPEFYAKIRLPKNTHKITIQPRYLRNFRYRYRRYKGKRHHKRYRIRRKRWFANPYKPVDPNRIKRIANLRRRIKKMRAKKVWVPTYRRFRHRRHRNRMRINNKIKVNVMMPRIHGKLRPAVRINRPMLRRRVGGGIMMHGRKRPVMHRYMRPVMHRYMRQGK